MAKSAVGKIGGSEACGLAGSRAHGLTGVIESVRYRYRYRYRCRVRFRAHA
ncbi:hypothetical protein [Streptomyces sp. NPDC017230]|uniref:hypothetical protein n=1 Tax=unclassified Streptomyces TaxID=2593676 RepID=UPI0037988B90